MRILFTFLCCLVLPFSGSSQDFYSDFDDGTLQGWTNNDGTVNELSVQPNASGNHLQKICDGTNTAVGEMTIINTQNWVGNYFYSPTGGTDEAMYTIDEILMRNSNSFDLYVRFGYTGSNGYRVVTTDPIVVPAQSDWGYYSSPHHIEFPTINNLTILNDTSGLTFEEIYENVETMFEDVIEFRIFHNDQIEYDGKLETGTLEIDELIKMILLSTGEQELSKIKLFPNPAKDMVTITLPDNETGNAEFYNVLGKKVLTARLLNVRSTVNLAELTSGMYLVSVKTSTSTTTKKLVKI
ncbi:putative secreted protein (Por secretion system target) [Ulvibacter sp. MAR_2010_11]|uniref:T9SS type A sorting domain-containing protein n=1 Tax=Ulvibacter sp. MAR_2010_11 TaxID=1250229 RepID=UPI000C2C9196|nr:T9SS type A sorting domain-containing protein [Ulvibacter sp. MAR_2010_11]PKA83940.1 putative secreted protein (Por secretion system target) [Ulvibacter sp. MAR_2010_11]